MRLYKRLVLLVRPPSATLGRDEREAREITEDVERLVASARAKGMGALAATWLTLMWDLIVVGPRHDLARALRSLGHAPAFTATVSLLSHRLWQGLGADSAIVGRTVHVEGRNWRVLGVMPADFAVPDVERAAPRAHASGRSGLRWAPAEHTLLENILRRPHCAPSSLRSWRLCSRQCRWMRRIPSLQLTYHGCTRST